MANITLYQMNILRECFLRYFIKKPMAKIPTTKAVIEAINKLIPESKTKPDWNKSNNFLSPDPNIIGTDSKKLNLAASSLFNPRNNPPEIVAPEREKPGTNARH